MVDRMDNSANVNHTYLYTASGERIADRNALNNTTTLTLRNLDGRLLRTYLETGTSGNGNTTWVEDEVWGGGQLLGTISPTAGTRYYAVDHLGTPRLVCDRCKDAKAQHDYYAFGLEASDPTQDAEPTRFTSQETDLQNTSGQTDDLVNMHARFYHPLLARFLSADPLSGNPHSPQSFNLFAYVRGNPVNYWDPYGMDEVQDPFHLARFYDETWVVGLDPWREAAEGWLSRDVFFFGIPTFDGGGSIMERLARQPRVPTMDDLLKQVTHVIECKETIGQLWAKNFAVTNQATIRMMFGGSSGRKISSSLRTGLGIAGGGTVADTFQLTTPFRWMAGGFRGMSLGGAEFTGVETGILAGTNSVITYGSVLLAYEGGVAVGSLVSVTFFGNCTDVAP